MRPPIQSADSKNLDGVNDYAQFGEKIIRQAGSYTIAVFSRLVYGWQLGCAC